MWTKVLSGHRTWEQSHRISSTTRYRVKEPVAVSCPCHSLGSHQVAVLVSAFGIPTEGTLPLPLTSGAVGDGESGGAWSSPSQEGGSSALSGQRPHLCSGHTAASVPSVPTLLPLPAGTAPRGLLPSSFPRADH